MKIVRYAFFHKQKHKIEVKNLTFCVYNVVQVEFFTRKIQKSQKSVFFFVNKIIIIFFFII